MSSTLENELEKTKSRLGPVDNDGPKRTGFLDKSPHKVSQRWPFACARIARICEGAAPARGHSFESACRSAQVPKLAQAFMELYAFYLTREKTAPIVGTDHNPFRYLPKREADAKFQRLVENICDKSSGRLGGWYVK